MSIDPGSQHYDKGGIETIAFMKAKLGVYGFIGALKSNLIKYPSRLGLKGKYADFIKDARKTSIYASMLEEFLTETSITDRLHDIIDIIVHDQDLFDFIECQLRDYFGSYSKDLMIDMLSTAKPDNELLANVGKYLVAKYGSEEE